MKTRKTLSLLVTLTEGWMKRTAIVIILCGVIFSLAFQRTAQAAGDLADASYFGFNNQRVVGTRRLLVILIQDMGQNPGLQHSVNDYISLVFGQGNPGRNTRDYFLEVSNGSFFFTWGGVIGPINAKLPGAFNEKLTAPLAVRLAGEQRLVDFSGFDANGDGTVTGDELSVLVIDNQHGHHGQTTSADVSFDNPKIRVNVRVSVMDDLGSLMTINHELAHTLGASPDLYAYPKEMQFHQALTLMGSTLYGNDDDRRTYHLDPWHKMQFGWLQPRVRNIHEAGSELLQAQQSRSGQGLTEKSPIILYDPTHGTSEFFLLEYRSKTAGGGSYDADVASSGLAIWQVRQDGTKRPVLIPSEAKPNLSVWTVFNRAAPSWTQGGTQLYQKSDGTIKLKWIDGADTGVRLHVGTPQNLGTLLPISWAPPNPLAILTGKFNKDGKTDIALTGPSGWGTLPMAFSNSNGTFNVTNYGINQFATWASQGATTVTGDFNGDGMTDIALTGPSGWVTLPVAFSNGNGTFNVTNFGNFGIDQFANWASQPGVKVLTGDFDKDGDTDIALTGPSGWVTLPVAFSNGNGTFSVTNFGNFGIDQFAIWASQIK